MDGLKLDATVLEATAQAITAYCNMQTEVMNEYLSRMSSLYSEWNDDQTIGPLIEEINRLKASVTALMDQINGQYPAYFREKAAKIGIRPKM